MFITGDSRSNTDTFTDGWWHDVDVDIESGTQDIVGKIRITVDGRPHISNRRLEFSTTEVFFIGGKSFIFFSFYPFSH